MSADAGVDAARRAFAQAPLSRRRAMVLTLRIDAAVAQMFDGRSDADLVAFRARLAADHPSLNTVMLLAQGDGARRLRLDAVAVPDALFPSLAVEDVMVSVYNGNTVPRIVVVDADGRVLGLAAELFDAAIAVLDALP